MAKPVAIPATVAGCFYGELRAEGAIRHADGVAAFMHWLDTVPREVGEEPETTKLREDLTELGAVEFARYWRILVELVRSEGIGHVYGRLHAAYAPCVTAGYERRERRTGHA
jgi:hypothetical protein